MCVRLEHKIYPLKFYSAQLLIINYSHYAVHTADLWNLFLL